MNKTYEVPEKKVCTRCGTPKIVKEFNLHHAKIKGNSKYRGECKDCQKLWRQENKHITAKAGMLYRVRHAEEIRRKKAEYLSNPENLERHRAYAREYGRKNPQRARDRLFKKYGITAQQYDEMFQNQNGGCAICGKEKNGKKMNFVIDHDHLTGNVRALLCTQCNAGIGNFMDSPSLLRQAATYLESFG